MSELPITDGFGPLELLLDAREEAVLTDDAQTAELAVIERIRQEVAARSDGLRRAIVFYRGLAADAKRTMEQAERRMERIKAYVQAEMTAAGIRRIDTGSGRLMVKGNGGLEPLLITDESLVPDEFLDVTITLPHDEFSELVSLAGTGICGVAFGSERTEKELWLDLIASGGKSAICNSRIREALAKQCPRCEGKKCVTVPDTWLPGNTEDVQCSECNGTGKQGVPGARLEPRGEHLEAK